MKRSYKQSVINAFNQADEYEKSAFIQQSVAYHLALKIKAIYANQPHPQRILEIGCGTGFLTEQLVKLFPEATYLVTDIAPEMIKRTKRRLENNQAHLEFRVMDAEQPSFSTDFDLICSSLVFQWFENLSDTLQKLHRYLRPRGWLVCTTLAKESFYEWRLACEAENLPCSIHAYPSLSDLQKMWPIEGRGKWEKEEFICRHSSALEFLKYFRNIGANIPSEIKPSLNAGEMIRLIKRFDQEGSSVTHQVAYGSFQHSAFPGIFVTGTDTDIGKTFVSACLVKAWNALYWKPIQTGLKTDLGDTNAIKQLLALSPNRIIPPWVELQEPFSPETAAEKEGKNLDFLNYSIPNIQHLTIVEGAGGSMVPISKDQLMSDLMLYLALPVIIVARSTLGTLNHTLLTIAYLREKGLHIAGVILNGVPNLDNRKAIEMHGKVRVLAEIPWQNNIDEATIAECVQYIPDYNHIISREYGD